MKYPETPHNEKERQNALNSYAILDTLPEKEYDEITFLASMICDTPMALISFVDEGRQWFKSNNGLATTETPREFAFCAHAINQKDRTFIVTDSREDERFSNNPLVTSDPNLVFYAGVPLVNPDGYPLGTLCVLDVKPKKLTSDQLKALEILSLQLMKLMELRKSTIFLHDTNKRLATKNKALDKFVSVAAHDIKSPINNILSLSSLLLEDHAPTMEGEAVELLDYIQTSAQHSTHLIDGILSYSKNANGISEHRENIHMKSLLQDVADLLISDEHVQMTIDADETTNIYANPTALHQIFSNLISNSIKYNHQDQIKIHVKVIETDSNLRIRVFDNGPGIKPIDKKRIFKLFSTTANKDRNGFHGTGIGLATVKNLVENLGGKISVVSEEGKGAQFRFSLKKMEAQVPA